MDMRQKHAIAYCRVSSKKQAYEGDSLENQEKGVRQIANKLNAIIVPRVFQDAFSGRKGHRPEFDEAVEYIKKHSGEIDYFIVWDIDRLTREGGAAYMAFKNFLREQNIQLVDAKGIIQPSVNLPELEELGFEYDWSRYSPSEGNEINHAQNAKEEVRKILGRTVPQEIRLSRQGYKVRAPNEGYLNSKVATEDGKKRTIQVPDPERAKFVITMFELRAQGALSDIEICEKINSMGYRSPIKNKWNHDKKRIIGKIGGEPLTTKKLQSLMRQTVYGGVMCEKWTKYQVVRTAYPGLVSVDLFNRANRGKVVIRELINGDLELLYDQKPVRDVQTRSKYNLHYPYRAIILCPKCRGIFKGSASRGKAGKYYANYHCSREHDYFRISQKDLDGSVAAFVRDIDFTPQFRTMLGERLMEEFKKNQAQILKGAITIQQRIENLEGEKAQAIERILHSESPIVQRELEKRVEEIERKIEVARSEKNQHELSEVDLEDFNRYASNFVEHFDEMLLNGDDLRLRQALFGLVFEEQPTYAELISGTPKLSLAFAKQKNHLEDGSLVVTPRGVEPRFTP